MVNVRLCFIELGSWLNYIIFVGCLYAINTDALPVFFLEESRGLPELFKLLGKSTEKMTLKDLENSFNRATEVLCISETDVTKIKERYKLTEKRNTEDSYINALKKIASDHRAVVFTLLRLNRFKLPVDKYEYNAAIAILNTTEGSKSPEVVAAIEAGDKKISANEGAEAYSEAFRRICKKWFAAIEFRNYSLLRKINMNPPQTLLELSSIFRGFWDLINDYQDKISDCCDITIAKYALSDLRNRLEFIEIMSSTPLMLYKYEDICAIIRKVVTLETDHKMRFTYLSWKKIDLIKSSKVEILHKMLTDANEEDSTELESIENDDDVQPSFIASQSKMYGYYVNCRFILLSKKSDLIDYIRKVVKEEGSTQNDFCNSWTLVHYMTMIHEREVILKGPTKKEKLEAIKKLEEVGVSGIYNFAKIIYNLPTHPPISKSKKQTTTLQANS